MRHSEGANQVISASDAVKSMYETGEPEDIVPDCVIHVNGEEIVLYPFIADWRNKLIAERAVARADWLARNNYPDHAGCHACGGFGRDHVNNLACFCDAGARVLERERREDEERTRRLRTIAYQKREQD